MKVIALLLQIAICEPAVNNLGLCFYHVAIGCGFYDIPSVIIHDKLYVD